jgi:hypothetical protein
VPDAVFDQLREHRRLDRLVGIRVAEEARDVDEHVLEQRLDLGRVRLQQ